MSYVIRGWNIRFGNMNVLREQITGNLIWTTEHEYTFFVSGIETVVNVLEDVGDNRIVPRYRSTARYLSNEIQYITISRSLESVFNSDFNLPYGMTIAAAVWGFWNKTQKLSETLWASFLSDTRLIPNCTSSTKIFPLYPIGLALVKQKRHAQVHFTCGKGLAGLVDGCMDGTAPISLPTTSPLHSDTLDYGR